MQLGDSRRRGINSRSFFAGFAAALALAASVAASAGRGTASAETPVVAFAARGQGHWSTGPATVINYGTTVTNEGNHWNGSNKFTAPVDGTYFFSVQFVKDTYYSPFGTKNDVWVRLRVFPPSGLPVLQAWAGKDAGGDRATGAMSTVLQLHAGATVKTKAYSADEEQRHLIRYYFSGFLIK